MKRAAEALARFLGTTVGVEGGFLALGTLLVAIGAGMISPVGPWLVVGGVCILVSLLLAIPSGRS